MSLQLPAQVAFILLSAWLSQSRSRAVRLRHNRHAAFYGSDKAEMRLTAPAQNAEQMMNTPWAIQMKAISIEEPSRLVDPHRRYLGWAAGPRPRRKRCRHVSMLFEFERQFCVDIYSVMIAAGLELSQSGHVRFTELCQCTRSHQQDCGREIASIDLEIQTFPVEMVHSACATGAA